MHNVVASRDNRTKLKIWMIRTGMASLKHSRTCGTGLVMEDVKIVLSYASKTRYVSVETIHRLHFLIYRSVFIIRTWWSKEHCSMDHIFRNTPRRKSIVVGTPINARYYVSRRSNFSNFGHLLDPIVPPSPPFGSRGNQTQSFSKI